MRNVKMSIRSTEEDVARLDAQLAEEGRRAEVPKGMSREDFAALALGRYLHLMASADLIIPVPPHLLSIADFARRECIRRKLVEPDYTIARYLHDAIYERSANVVRYHVLGDDPADLIRWDEALTREDSSGEEPKGRAILFGVG